MAYQSEAENVMKKIAAGLLAALVLVAASCSGEPKVPVTEENSVKTYEQLYNGNAVTKYEPVTGAVRYRASYGYTDNDVQGYNRWYYLGGDDLAPMLRVNGAWEGSGARIEGGVLSPGGGTAALRFDPPLAGAVTVSGTLRMSECGGEGVSLKIMQGDIQVYPSSGSIFVSGNDLTGRYFAFSTELISEPLDFIVTGEGKAYCNPTVDYTNQRNESLYGTPEWGYYGDVHEYYFDDRVNMFHLRNFGGDNWEWYLDTTTDMFRYERAKVYDTSFVENHYMAYAAAGDLIDYSVYPAGGRDCTLFLDENAGIYRYIGLTYKTRSGYIDCDLSMRTSKSNDLYGDWNTAIPLRRFPGTGEPECAAFRKIDDTWFLYCGISGQTVHHVGGLSYWKGEKGAGIDETDWLNATTYRLDGEDLCVPQIEEVGGRWYMWGWMPQKYNRGDWGGYMNLPREVYVQENGLLGTRLDEMATKLVNRGKLLDVNGNSFVSASGKVTVREGAFTMLGTNNRVASQTAFDSTFVTFRLDMRDSSRAGFLMQANGREYYAVLLKKEGGTYLQIGCPDDVTHPVSSEVYLGSADETVFDCKIVTDGVWRLGNRNGTNVEFFVNDKIALSGRIALDMAEGYVPAFYSDAEAVFEDVEINRLAQLYDIYD